MKTEIYLFMIGGLYVYGYYGEDWGLSVKLGRDRKNVDLMFRTQDEAVPMLSQFPEFTLFRETTELAEVTLTPTQKRQDRYS